MTILAVAFDSFAFLLSEEILCIGAQCQQIGTIRTVALVDGSWAHVDALRCHHAFSTIYYAYECGIEIKQC